MSYAYAPNNNNLSATDFHRRNRGPRKICPIPATANQNMNRLFYSDTCRIFTILFLNNEIIKMHTEKVKPEVEVCGTTTNSSTQFTAIFNERRKREKRSPTKLYNFTSEEIGLSTAALATFYRHQKSPQRSSLDKIKNWIEKENRKKNNSVIISGSGSNSNRNNFSAELARPSSTNIILDDNNDDR
ncbi:hypothetical protein Glove_66g170 [Diversispora epigaea]|uniref:Uncharacterized protein n=1 Tax=Diversispora epigaea TaxID=1348612 RepID=A0A397JKE3_9GLOM|nr:hypothetical protein Glove_66g170 [Diversispora epigaea]